MIKTGKVLVALFFFWSWFAVAGVKVIATVDRDKLSEGDSFIYSINISSDSGNPRLDAEPKLPDLSGLDLISTSSSTESKSSFINGQFMVEQTRSFDYQMAAPRKGTFKIGAATVIVEGKEFRTQPITITVAAAGAGQRVPPQARNQPNPFGDDDEVQDMFNQLLQRHMRPGGGGGQAQVNPNDAFFIQVEVDKNKVYAGEQLTASWYLYTRGQIADIDTLKYPDLKGFWKEEIEMATRLNFQQAVVNGVVYQKALLVSYALFPIKAGKSVIDPYKAKCTVVVGGPFGFGRSYPATKASREVPIEVMAVPAEGRPPEFSGAIGHFQVTSQLDQNNVPANQPVTLKIKFTGRGNAKLIDLPPLNLPKSLELYSQKADANFFKDGTSYKEFEVLLIPREAGQFAIPPVKAAYFDPEKHRFESTESNALSINVTPGKPGETPSVAPTAGGGDQAPKTSDEPQLPPPLTLDGDHSWQSAAAAQPFWLGIFAFVFAVLGFKSYTVFFRKPKRESLEAALKRRLRAVQSSIDAGDWRKAGVELTNSIYLILGQITEQGGANLEFEKLMEAAPPSLRRELSQPLRSALDKAEQLGFAPEGAVGPLKEKREMNNLRKEIEQVLTKAIVLGDRGPA